MSTKSFTKDIMLSEEGNKGGRMKYRIVQYKNGRFGIQHKRIFIWWDETFITNDDMTFLETFDSVEKAEEYLEEKFYDKFAIMRVVKICK